MDAKELFDICLELATAEPSTAATRRLHEVLKLTAAEGCRRQGGAFGNLFAQVDYLCRRLSMDVDVTIGIQTARRHSNTGAAISHEDWPHDVMAVARLVEAVFATHIPGKLLSALPHFRARPVTQLRADRTYVRCIVERFTDTMIEANTSYGRIAIDYGCDEGGRDFSYLRKILRVGMQLNLLDCKTDSAAAEGTVVPGMVVVEPDFLLDISSLSACFTSYGHHPLLYTLNRLKPRPNSQATLLGNFAGTALDEMVSAAESKGPRPTLAACLQRSFREQALRLLACPDFDADKFRQQAEEQMKNIGEAVDSLEDVSQDVNFLLEPSFVCEKLGLQGRVDLMTPLQGSGFQVPGFRFQDSGSGFQDSGSGFQDSGFRFQDSGSGFQDSGFRFQDSGSGFQDSGFRFQDLGSSFILVEQKSGRNAKIEYLSHDSYGLQLENHYVQLLLYYGVMRYNFGLSDRQVDMRLLYSRYPAARGLLTVNYYRTLLREAIKLRNQIVATELLIARQGFGRIVPLLTADCIYKDVVKDGFFDRFAKRELEMMQQSITQLQPLERAYYETMMTFVYREQAAAKLGSAEGSLHHSAGSASDLWLMSLDEKAETGNIVYGMMIDRLEPQDTTDGWSVVRLIPEKGASLFTLHSSPNFRPGDMVYLYPYTDKPDVRHAMLFKGLIKEMDGEQLTVALTNVQHSAMVFNNDGGRRWAVEHGGSDVGTSSAIRAMQVFVTANPRRRALLLGQREPEADTRLRLSRSYNEHYDDVLLAIRRARDYYLLMGPPGTGKTSQALRFIVEEELHCGSSILLTAYTHRAVDEICAMLCSLMPKDGTPDGTPFFLRLGKAASCDARYHAFLLDSQLAHTHRLDDARQLLEQTRIVVGTTATLQAQSYLLEVKHFHLAIVDEASQILEPSVIGILASDAIERFVLVGDHKQLPAVVQQEPAQSLVTDRLLADIGLTDCRLSLFERLLRWEHRQGRTQFTGTLHRHGRMHPEVAGFTLANFYQREQLCPVPLPHQQETALNYEGEPLDALDLQIMKQRMLFIPTQPEHGETEQEEAEMVADIIGRIYRLTKTRFNPQSTIGVIVPYRRQIALIQQALAKRQPQVPRGITIDTVERYQGSQRDVIVYSFAVSHAYQLDFITASTFTDDDGTIVDRKLNVALTRARHQNILVGRRDILCRVPLFAKLF